MLDQTIATNRLVTRMFEGISEKLSKMCMRKISIKSMTALMFLTAVTTATNSSTWNPDDCKGQFKCTCLRKPDDTVHFSCIFKNFSQPTTEGLLFLKNTTKIDLSHNKFKELRHYVFDQFSPDVQSEIQKLLILVLSHNEIKTISSLSFIFMNNLQELDISNNKIQRFEPDIFKPLNNLRVLNLNYNPVKTLPPQVFDGLSKLEALDLSSCRLSDIQWTAFSFSNRSISLNLTNNYLRTFHPNYFQTPAYFDGIIDLSNNPIVCDCYLQWLYITQYARESLHNVTLTCSGPPDLKGLDFFNLNTSHFKNCNSDLIVSGRGNAAVVGVVNAVTVLSCKTIPGIMISGWTMRNTTSNSDVTLPGRFSVTRTSRWVYLTIQETQKADEGVYTCHVIARTHDAPNHKSTRSVTLRVVEVSEPGKWLWCLVWCVLSVVATLAVVGVALLSFRWCRRAHSYKPEEAVINNHMEMEVIEPVSPSGSQVYEDVEAQLIRLARRTLPVPPTVDYANVSMLANQPSSQYIQHTLITRTPLLPTRLPEVQKKKRSLKKGNSKIVDNSLYFFSGDRNLQDYTHTTKKTKTSNCL